MRLLAPGDTALGLVCERGPEQVEFWQQRAWNAHTAGTAKVYVLAGHGSPPIYGFFAICMARVVLTELPAGIRQASGLPAQCPVALLAQLARDDRAPKGTGAELVGAAVEKIVELSEDIGCIGIVLDAKNSELVKYYETLGFTPIGTSKNTTRRMFLSLQDARAAVVATKPAER